MGRFSAVLRVFSRSSARASSRSSPWATEHIIVGPEAVDPYGRVYDPLVTLGSIVGRTERIGLGTSIVLVPLHNPMHLAKQVATLQELSGGRFTLGVGWAGTRMSTTSWGIPFEGRGRRADEAIRLLRALWDGERDFEGEYWSFHDATSLGARDPALELGDVWHPSRGSDAEHVRQVKEQHPELRVIPRTAPENVEAMLEAGAEGAVVSFGDEAGMCEFARHHR